MTAGGGAFLSLVLMAAAPLPEAPSYRTFGQWVVGCDNTRRCEARGFDDEAKADLRVLRDAGVAHARLVLSLTRSPGDPVVSVDGKRIALAGPHWVRKTQSGSPDITVETDDETTLKGFLAATRDGHRLVIDSAQSVPLDGMRAALLFMDASQGRVGTEAPLVARRGADSVPAFPGLPPRPTWTQPSPLSEGEKQALQVRAKALPLPDDADCDLTEDAQLHALDARNVLAIRPCRHAAYQSVSMVFVLPRQGDGLATPVSLRLPAIPKDEGAVQGPDMIDPDFNAKDGSLSVISRGRGIDDVGLTAGWVWSEGGFRLSHLYYLGKGGEPGPGDFLTLFRVSESGLP